MKPILFLLLTMSFCFGQGTEKTASPNVSTFLLEAPQLDVMKKIWVYTPHNYNTTNKKYPVIYMPDGQNLFDKSTAYSGEWRIDETLDSLKAEVIIIGIEHGGDKRISELTPYKNEKYGGGEADTYLDFIINTLKPHIDKTMRTKKNRDNTMIFGSSLGGLTAFYALINYPDTFGKAGVFSPSFWYTNDIYELAGYVENLNAKMYFMAGDSESEDMVPDLDRMEKIILQKVKGPMQIHKKIVPGGKHNEALWGKEFAQAYLWLIKK
jgi:predicted alpha/beta superfamily hydrolase